MGAFKDLTGQRFGRLVVVERAEDYVSPKGHHDTRWHCRCDCGKELDINTSSLKSGRTTSCGCYRYEVLKESFIKDLSGMRFGRLIVLHLVYNEGPGVIWHCKCDCGEEVDVKAQCLQNGDTRSCGCLAKEGNNYRHGGARNGKLEKLYRVWEGMKERCYNPNHRFYNRYGGKGITICDEWLNYAVFREWAISNGYDENAEYRKCTIDRIDNSKGYSPDNCRWVSQSVQNNNCSRNRILTYNNESHNIKEWSEITGLSYATLSNRLRRGYSVEDTLTLPQGGKRNNGIRSTPCA